MTATRFHTAFPTLRDIEEMTEDERLEEIAGILARGVLRLHSAGALRCHAEKSLPESPSEGLDLSDPARPHRSQVVNATKNPEGGDA